MSNPNFASIKDVTSALLSLGFQPSAETIQTISRNCRDEFLESLSRCVTGQDNDGSSKLMITNLLRSLSPDTLNRLTAIVPCATGNMIVPVALKAPARFLSAIDAASNREHPRHDAAQDFLKSVFAPNNREVSQQTSAPINDELDGRAEAASVRVQEPARSRMAPTQIPSEQKKYHSCHVYGSGYALCFNASSWEGKPGVMVDAAVSNGPKAYDWKNAVHVWLDTNEVGAVLAVFRRWRRGIEFSAHGSLNDKSFAIEFQGQHFFAKVSAKKLGQHPTRAVKIMPTDATAVSILFLAQLAESYPSIPLNELLATVRATHQIHDAAAA